MNKPLILIVEDDSSVKNLITTTLKAHDYRYLTAPNGKTAADPLGVGERGMRGRKKGELTAALHAGKRREMRLWSGVRMRLRWVA